MRQHCHAVVAIKTEQEDGIRGEGMEGRGMQQEEGGKQTRWICFNEGATMSKSAGESSIPAAQIQNKAKTDNKSDIEGEGKSLTCFALPLPLAFWALTALRVRLTSSSSSSGNSGTSCASCEHDPSRECPGHERQPSRGSRLSCSS